MDTTPAWNEREVRRVLRGLRRPHLLAKIPLALRLCDAYGSTDPHDATRRFVRETFAGGGLVGGRLEEIIVRSDFDASLPLVAIAKEMGLSPRQFFRYRREAIRALAESAQRIARPEVTPSVAIAQVADLVEQTDPETASALYAINRAAPEDAVGKVELAVNSGLLGDVVLPPERGPRLMALCRVARACFLYGDPAAGRQIMAFVHAQMFDAVIEERRSIEFELAWLTYLNELYCRTAASAHAAAVALSQCPTEHDEQGRRAYMMLADASLRTGDERGAREAIAAAERLTSPSDVRTLTVLLACRGGLAFLSGDYATTDACYTAASIVLGKRTIDQWNTLAHAGRARRLLGRPWRAPAFALAVEDLAGGRLVLSASASVALPHDSRTALGRIGLELLALRCHFPGDVSAAVRQTIADHLDVAKTHDYLVIVALAHAMLAEVASANGRDAEARAHVIEAWNAWTKSVDCIAAVDLFFFADPGAYSCTLGNEHLADAVADWARAFSPDHPFGRMSPTRARNLVRSTWDARTAAEGPPCPEVSFADPAAAAVLAFVAPANRAVAAARLHAGLAETAP